MRRRWSRWALITPAVLIAAGGCLASKGDIRLLQDQLTSMQSRQTYADSLQRMQVDSALRLLARATDSLRSLDTRFAAFQAKTTGDLYDINRQLITVQELTGQSQSALQRLRASLDARAEAAAAAPPPAGPPTAPGDTTTRPSTVPGPALLFQTGVEQMQRGSYFAARGAFQDLITHYPNDDEAPMAQLYIAQAYEAEKNRPAADSVYMMVATKYPRNPSAATALYKYAQSQLAQGHKAQARVALDRVIRDFPNSDVHDLAADLRNKIK